MSTMTGKIKLLQDAQLRINSAVTALTLGAAQNKGTATDLLLTVIAGPDGANAVGGTTIVALQGSNVTGSAASNWTNVTPDKPATLPAAFVGGFTASGAASVHAAQLQFQYYRVQLSNGTSATVNVYTNFAYMPTEDSFDATVQ